ncbi:hypothetical protein WR25_18895 isoform B [Diploscapter pachys]|uniref:Amine oxidase domain-containing protein n=1 Tax=Diploscapter pachys TaxID=2018661 RepID=A0A2A2KHA8_9BILA|nr:hypothetical protein WR25_18895 isoform A [Diploscapter pachys]PAV73316.1 hypothetical protein WR25_18895 isoform B [Diploscapter pachys]
MGGRAQPVNTEHRECGRVRFDLGCSFINGVVGNPLTVLMKQVNFSPLPIRTEMQIFDEFGKQISTKRDQLLEATFVNISDSVDYVTKERNVKTLFGKPMNLNDAYDHMANLLELHVRKTRLQYWNQYGEVVNMLADTQKQIEIYEETIRTIGQKIEELDERKGSQRFSLEEQTLKRCLSKELEKALAAFDQATERYANLQMALSNVKKKEPCVTYMNQRDLRLLDFYKALREFTIGGMLQDVSAENWDQEVREDNEANKFAPYRISDTIYTLIRTIAAKDTIQLEHHVTRIEYNAEGVKVHALIGNGDKEEVFQADCVLSTIPLGVLKKSVSANEAQHNGHVKENGENGTERGKQEQIPVFEPPLPKEKVEAIEKLGCGSVAKLALVFEKQFWDAATDFVGHLNSTRESRGEMFLFFCHQNQPVIEIFFSGQAALSMDADLESTTRKAMTILNQIYGGACPKWPTNIYVTNFTKKRTHLGTHSYVTPGNDGSEYDVMAEPVKAKIEDEYSGPERVFFAGEHTCRAAPSTLHGAFMSGLREAARIADIHLGCPFARDKEPECIELEDESDDDDDAILIDDENQKSRENSKTPADAATQQIEDTTHTDSQSVQKPAKTEEITLEDENELLGIAASGDSQNAPAPSTSESVEEVTMEADKPTEEGEKKDQDDDSTALDQLIAEHKTDA